MPDQRLRRRERLLHRGDYDRVYARQCRAGDGTLLVYVDRNGLGWSRLGLSVGRKAGGAVARNRIRRRIREGFRLSKESLPGWTSYAWRTHKRSRRAMTLRLPCAC